MFGLVLVGSALPGIAGERDISVARYVRDPAVAHEFQRLNPCPATGRTNGACPGYIRDHIVPLHCGGSDTPSNMQWQTILEARTRDRGERHCDQTPTAAEEATRRVTVLPGRHR